MKKIIFLVGPSGCGKSHLQDKLLENFPNRYNRIITTVTRPPRDGEEDGVNYHFESKHYFKYHLDKGNFLQHVEFGGHFYGTTVNEYNKEEDTGIFVCTPEGINDTINALKNRGRDMSFEIFFFLTTKNLLKKHGVSQERIDRGDIIKNFVDRYTNNEFNGTNIMWIEDDDVDDHIHYKVDDYLTGRN